MSLPVPNLDDRTFLDLVTQARERIKASCPSWTDLSVHDPGIALLEAFSFVTEAMIYRLNQVPEAARVSYLNLLGVTRHAPAAAWADVTFTRAPGTAGGGAAVKIPAGTRVAAARGADPQPVVFVSTEPAELPAGADEVTVRLHHCEPVVAELLGLGTGQAGQTYQAARAPMVHTVEALDLLLGVEVPAGAVEVGAAAREHGGKVFEIWRQVSSFAGADADDKVFLVDRSTGRITFAPALDLRAGADPEAPSALLAAVPPAGREIRIWYRTGGGTAGNVAAGSLRGLRTPIAGIKEATNRTPARGGRPVETLESALARGPYEFYSQQRAVTARDFEILATSGSGAVARARAFTRAAVLSFARAGEVEVVLVPYVPDDARPGGRLPLPVLRSHEVEEARRRTEDDLNQRRALGTSVIASWARYKAVSIKAVVVVRPEEDVDAVRRRIHDRLYQTLSPLPTSLNPSGWQFGEPLRASNVYRWLEQAEPGVRYVDKVRFQVDEAPDANVVSLAADQYQQQTWYAAAGEVLFRSGNSGVGWEAVGRFPGERVLRVVPAPAPSRPGITPRPGSVAVITKRDGGDSCRIHLSTDLGDSWRAVAGLETHVHDLTWIDRDGSGALLLATDSGLYEVSLLPKSVPLQILVDPADPDRGFYAVRAFVSERGAPGVALAAQTQYGVYLSSSGGLPNTFRHIGLANTDTRTIAVQYDGPATLLWAGAGEPDPTKPGKGCYRTRLYEADVQWQNVNSGWVGGTCRALTFAGTTAVAATQSGGVVRLDTASPQATWQSVQVNCGLPLRDRSRFEPVDSIAAGMAPGKANSGRLILAGGVKGVYRSEDAYRWAASANQETGEVVTVPDTWLLCSGTHEIEVISGDASTRD